MNSGAHTLLIAIYADSQSGRSDKEQRWLTRFIRLLQQYMISETNSSSMAEEIEDADRAIEIVRDYADDECVGEFGEVLDARQGTTTGSSNSAPTRSQTGTNIAYNSRPLAIYSHMTVRPKSSPPAIGALLF